MLKHHYWIPAGDLRRQDNQFDRSSVLATCDAQLADSERAGEVRGTLADMSQNPADEFVTKFIRAQRGHLGAQETSG